MSYSSTVLATANLTAFWQFDETAGTVAADAVGTATLTMAGGVTPGSSPLPGDGVRAFTFARSTNGRASRAASYPESDFAIEGWFQASDTATVRQCIAFNGSGSNGFGLFLNKDNATGQLHILFQGVAWQDTGYSPGTSKHHFVLTRGAAGTALRLYIDGVEVYSTTNPGNTPAGAFVVGAEDSTGLNGFNGVIDAVATYAAALPAATVTSHYQAGGGVVAPVSAQSGDWATAATWTAGTVPLSTDIVTIASGHTVTVSDVRTCAGWTQKGSGVLAIAATGSLTSTGNTLVEGDGTATPKVTLAAGAALLWAPATGVTITARWGTDYYRYAELRARGTAAARCTIGKAAGAAGTLVGRTDFLWLQGIIDAEFADFTGWGSSTTDAVDLSSRYQGIVRFINCRFRNGGRWNFSLNDLGAPNTGKFEVVDSTWEASNGPENLVVGAYGNNNVVAATLTRCDFAGVVSLNWQGGSNYGNLTLSDNTFRKTFVGTWPGTYVVSSGNFHYQRAAVAASGMYTLSGTHTDSYFLADYTDNPGAGNPHFWDFNRAGDSLTVQGGVFDYNGPFNTDTGDVIDLGDGDATLRRCIVLPSSVAGKSTGAAWWLGGVGTLALDHCTVYAAGSNDGLQFPHSANMSVGRIPFVKSNLFWNDQATGTNLAIVSDTPTFTVEDSLTPAGCTANAFVGMSAGSNTVAGAAVNLNGFGACKFSVAPTGNQSLAIGGATFVDSTRNFLAWARQVRGKTGTNDVVRDAAVADIVADRTLVRLSLIPWVRAGFAPQAASLATAGHDGMTVGAVQQAGGGGGGGGGLTAGNITITVAATASEVTLTVTEASGGTAPYTRKWYRSTLSGFTPSLGTELADASGLTYVDKLLTPSTTYYYKVVHADSAAAKVTTAQKQVITTAASLTLTPLARLASWESRIHHRHASGGAPYVAGGEPNPNGPEHYDVTWCMMNARDYCVHRDPDLTPIDWSTQIAAGITQYRDGWIIGVANYGAIQGIHVYTRGMAEHYRESSDPLDVAATSAIVPDPSGKSEEQYRGDWEMHGGTREVSYHMQGCLDREWLGLGHSEFSELDAELLLGHIAQWTVSRDLRYGRNMKPFMCGLCAKSLIAYWDRYRGDATPRRAAIVAAIPAAIESLLAVIWADGYWAAGPSRAINGSGEFWDKGGVKYSFPAGDDPSLAWILGLTVVSLISQYVFTGPQSLSAIDGYYNWMQFGLDPQPPNEPTMYVVDYVGSTRQFTIKVIGGNITFPQGSGFHLVPNGGQAVGGGFEDDRVTPDVTALVSPAYAWAYWHRKVILGDATGAAVHRMRHDAMFDGQTMAWAHPLQQKQWNQAMLWETHGLDWRARGDAGEWPAASAFALQAPATGAVGTVGVQGGALRLSIPHGVNLAGPKVVTPASSTGLGTFVPPTAVLTTDRPTALFRYTPAAADDGTTITLSATAPGLTSPAPVAYTVGTVAAAGNVLLVASPAGGILMLSRP